MEYNMCENCKQGKEGHIHVCSCEELNNMTKEKWKKDFKKEIERLDLKGLADLKCNLCSYCVGEIEAFISKTLKEDREEIIKEIKEFMEIPSVIVDDAKMTKVSLKAYLDGILMRDGEKLKEKE